MEKSKTAKKLVNAEVIAAMRTQYAGVLFSWARAISIKTIVARVPIALKKHWRPLVL